MRINAELAYKLEKYRQVAYLPLWSFIIFWIFTNLYTPWWGKYKIWSLIFVVITLFYLLAYFYFSTKSKWISLYATMEMQEARYGSYERSLLMGAKDKLKHAPFTAIILSLLSVLGYYYFPKAEYGFKTTFISDSLWQVHASILALVFAVLTFLITLVDSKESEKSMNVGKKLAKETYFVHITVVNLVANLFLGIVTLFTKSNNLVQSISIGLFVFLILSIVFLFRRFIVYILEKNLIKSVLIEQRKEYLRLSLSNEIREKISHQIFVKLITPLQIHFAYSQEVPNSLGVRSNRNGKIVDVNIDLLTKIAKRIEGYVSIKNYQTGNQETYKAAIHKSFNLFSYVSDTRDLLANLPNIEKNKNLIPKVEKIFHLKREEEKEEDDASNKLRDLTTEVIEYVNVSPRNSIEALKSWSDLIKESLKTMKDYNLDYNRENSKDTTTLDWSSIRALSYGLFDIFSAVFKNGDRDLVLNTLEFLEDQISVTLEYKNFFLFKEFLFYYVRGHHMSLTNLNDDTKKSFNQSVQKKLKSFVKYKIRLDGDDVVEKVAFDFETNAIIEIQNSVKELIRLSLNKQDSLGTDTFITTLSDVSSTLKDHRNGHNLENEIFLLQSSTGSQELSGSEAKIEFLTNLIAFNKKLERRKLMIAFALGAWCIELYRGSKVNKDFITTVLPKFQSYFRNNSKLLAEIFYELKDFHREEEFGLSSWELHDNESEEAIVRTIRLDWLTYFYVLTGLDLLPETLNSTDFLYGKDMHQNSSPDLELTLKDITDTFSKIEASPGMWSDLLQTRTRVIGGTATQLGVDETYNNLERKGDFILLHERGVEKRKEEESQFLATTPIHEGQWNSFKEQFLNAYTKATSFKNILRKYGNTLKLKNATSMKDSFGIFRIEFKYSFIEKWYISSHGRAENFGSGMVAGENNNLLTTLLARSKKVTQLEKDENLLLKIDGIINDLKKVHSKPNVLLTGDWNSLFVIKNSKDFVIASQEERDSLHGYEGIYKGLAVFQIKGIELSDTVIIADLKKTGLLVETPYDGQDIKMEVRVITEQDIDEWISKDAPVLTLPDGTKMNKEEAIQFFADRVHLEILEKMEYKKPAGSTKGVKYSRYFKLR